MKTRKENSFSEQVKLVTETEMAKNAIRRSGKEDVPKSCVVDLTSNLKSRVKHFTDLLLKVAKDEGFCPTPTTNVMDEIISTVEKGTKSDLFDVIEKAEPRICSFCNRAKSTYARRALINFNAIKRIAKSLKNFSDDEVFESIAGMKEASDKMQETVENFKKITLPIFEKMTDKNFADFGTAALSLLKQSISKKGNFSEGDDIMSLNDISIMLDALERKIDEEVLGKEPENESGTEELEDETVILGTEVDLPIEDLPIEDLPIEDMTLEDKSILEDGEGSSDELIEVKLNNFSNNRRNRINSSMLEETDYGRYTRMASNLDLK